MATLNLGRLKPVFRGAWNNATAYNVDDIVVRTNESYISIQAGSNQDPASASAYWTKMAAKGADGTDVGATLANKEIAFKTNAGAVDGIPIGTAGQFLKVNSGATGYEYGAVSSDFVKLGSVTASASGVVTFDNLFTSDYKVYKIFIKRAHGSTDNSSIRVRYRGGGSQLTSSVYKNFHAGGHFSSSSNTNVLNRSWNDVYINLTLNGLDNNVQHGLTAEYTLFDPQASDVRKNHICHMAHNVYDQTLFYNYTAAGVYDDTTVLTGIEFYMNTGNISGIFTLYGIKE